MLRRIVLSSAFALIAVTPAHSQSQAVHMVTGTAGSLEGALVVFRGNANSRCLMYGFRPGGFEFGQLTLIPAGDGGYQVRGQITCNSSQLISREDFISRAAAR